MFNPLRYSAAASLSFMAGPPTKLKPVSETIWLTRGLRSRLPVRLPLSVAFCFLPSAFSRFAPVNERPLARLAIVHQGRDRRNHVQPLTFNGANQTVVMFARVADNLWAHQQQADS